LVKLVIRLSKLAKIAAASAMVGGCLAIYGKINNVPWMGGVGTVLLFGGAVVYYFERFRMLRARTRARTEAEKPLGPRHDDSE